MKWIKARFQLPKIKQCVLITWVNSKNKIETPLTAIFRKSCWMREDGHIKRGIINCFCLTTQEDFPEMHMHRPMDIMQSEHVSPYQKYAWQRYVKELYWTAFSYEKPTEQQPITTCIDESYLLLGRLWTNSNEKP